MSLLSKYDHLPYLKPEDQPSCESYAANALKLTIRKAVNENRDREWAIDECIQILNHTLKHLKQKKPTKKRKEPQSEEYSLPS